MKVTHKINADLQICAAVPRLTMVQSDLHSREMEITVTSGGIAWIPENIHKVLLQYRKSDGTGGSYDTLPDGNQAWAINGNKITICVAPQMLTVPGLVEAQVILGYDEQRVATFAFQIIVEGDLSEGIIKSEDYTNWTQWTNAELQKLLQQAKESGEFAGAHYVPSVDAEGNLSWSNDAGMSNPEPVNIADLISGKLNGTVLKGEAVGDIDMNGYRISALPEPQAADDAATMGYALNLVREAAPQNLLDNADFTNPVNQRLSGSYTATGASYTIDRWRLDSGKKLTVNTGSITIDGGWMTQFLEPGKIDTAKTYTAVLCNTNGDIHAETGIFANKTRGTYWGFDITASGIPFIGILKADSYQWAALYEGAYTSETLPQYRPKGYAAEFAECCRYAYAVGRYNTLSGFITGSAKEIWTTTFMPAPMRMVAPSVATLPRVIIRCVDGYSPLTPNTSSAITPTSVICNTEHTGNGQILRTRFYFDSAVGSNNTPAAIFLDSGFIISADL